ncbi:MAG: Txe/YoeB family addiction module toxin [Gammaproteobacteria bacterium]|nr:Txe/YoeB family addiction module toxin [Gammaproteobacteria bacterium]MBU0850180.1 Txe/YoeB family addiction module toxin [Gammaproteobacteria bacterium]MBU1268777.1 Txe/YoeB family addiction module toxin [Gammaproteobacteria bacterium]MBU1780849.1 Txe/YoeB family addiction module toxin [Gammaproteobacteria bacterium]MBU2087332.1 Txe/YoeB family addiction module toxin [Gammaproteobacteria bacterium]
MKIIFSEAAWEDYLYWQKTDKKLLNRTNELIKAIMRTPFEGIGKPEPLKHGLAGYWSRRISDEHRLVYKAQDESLLIAQCRYQY